MKRKTISVPLVRSKDGNIDVSATLKELMSNAVAVHAMVEYGKVIEGARK